MGLLYLTSAMRYLFFFCLLIHYANCSAQGTSHGASSSKGFTPREHVIFEDDFSHDTLGHFPHKWKESRKYLVGVNVKTHSIVRREGADKVLSTDGLAWIKPMSLGALTDSFTVECDFMQKSKTSWIGIAFRLDKNGLDSDINKAFFFSYEDQRFTIFSCRETLIEKENTYESYDVPPVVFSYNQWCHLAFSYCHRHISCYLDSTRILDIPDCGFRPFGLSIGLRDTAICKHVVIANGKPLDFNSLVTEKKFVTHAILFETNKAVINEDSNPFLIRFAAWLLKNPGVSIEIDGHTDSVGSAVSNRDLSVNRAEEVKRQLVAKGVPASRLTTKGLGATMPLKSNQTGEGRAENRRVEFVLLEK